MTSQKLAKVALIAITLCIASAPMPQAMAKKVTKTKTVVTKASTQSTDLSSQIRAQVAKLQKALADADYKAIGALWSTDGTYTGSEGAEYKGRAAVENRFKDVIAEGGKQLVMLDVLSVRSVADNVAIAEGVVRRKTLPISISPETRFTMVMSRQGGNWLVDSAVETPMTAAASINPLKDLSWMIGYWSAQNNGGSVKMKAEWAANQNFITCTYETKKSPESPAVDSKQVIGWDPREERFVSWHFDSNGGYGHGTWEKVGNKWVVRAGGMDRDGSVNASTTLLTYTDQDSFTFQSVDRSVDGVPFSDGVPLKVQRITK